MTPKIRTLEGKNRTLGGDWRSKIVKNRRTSFMDDPQGELYYQYYTKPIEAILSQSIFSAH